MEKYGFSQIKSKGFTLVELLVAIGILLLVLGGAVGVEVLNIRLAAYTKHQQTATNIAEGQINKVKSARDAKLLGSSTGYSDFLDLISDYTKSYRLNNTAGVWAVSQIADQSSFPMSLGNTTYNVKIKFSPVGIRQDIFVSNNQVNSTNSEKAIYVLDERGREIKSFNYAATKLKNPDCIAVDIKIDNKSNLYVADGGNHRIAKYLYDNTGRNLDFKGWIGKGANGAWNTTSNSAATDSGNALDEFNHPEGITIFGDYMYITDQVPRVQRCRLDTGKCDASVTLSIPVTNYINQVAVSPEGKVYVTDSDLVASNGHISRFDADLTNPLTKAISSADGPPESVVIAGDVVYVSVSSNPKVKIITFNKNLDRQGSFLTNANGVEQTVIGADGNLYLVNDSEQQIIRYAVNGSSINLLDTWSFPGIPKPIGIAIRPTP
ncbi:TPA: prepilin-type cleavage/methylation domain-containing protein [Candidatus Berkelbacteria bacterium]|uniref:NHL repeat containing protein n=1 Tax=Berkelbacteria bacterium GW2011_GWE1_39_12 TaxID=1618337 RepID=A0A0G4B2T9_9BACT|nr:MAG: hypothetical protein UT28_C0001G0071 [Berkelbacteria bacterium GW2011_GWE1_39_12]HBO60463.1 prepilin-type cleavage/methylation domain-containing protein [Candidatus Berkelbacteria bacterium]